ncbi:hypothetical protein MKX03_000160 [Papaver bracteatum]|nr:hypothetical protein MKX03_000160 [Papaver bracteatum]
MWNSICKRFRTPVFAILMVQLISVTNNDKDLRIVIAYRSIFAVVPIVPLAFFAERGMRPQMTWSILFQLFLCALFGYSVSNYMYVESMRMITGTYTAGIGCLIPLVNLILAVFWKLELFAFQAVQSKLTMIGIVMAIGGAMVLTLYKGAEIPLPSFTHFHMRHKIGPVPEKTLLGIVLAFGSVLSHSTWLVIQAKLSESYPCCFSSAAWIVSMASIQSVAYALCTVTDWSQWRLQMDILFMLIYTVCVVISLITWCINLRGPLFASSFGGLASLMATICGLIIAARLYFLLWGWPKKLRRMLMHARKVR